MQLKLSRGSMVPLYRQLAAELRERIVSGAVAEGYRLPPERELASRLDVNRTTVLQAYQQLKDEGLIASKVGKGTFVLPASVVTPHHMQPPWSVLFSDYSNRFTYHDIASAERAQRGDTVIDFATGSPNPADIPDDLLRAVSIEAFASHEFDGQPESPIEGFDELRELLAEHMRARNVQCDVRNIMVLSGSEQGIDLCVRAFINPGDCVLVEQSTFFPALQAFRSADARIIGVPVDEYGMRTDLLEGYCARFRPKFIYTIPTFHNPTGATLPAARRTELIDVARRYQCLIIEDDAYGELWYGGRSTGRSESVKPAGPAGVGMDGVTPGAAEGRDTAGSGTGRSAQISPIPLKGMENAGYVIYLSTFSKTITSGLRTGWIVADPHVINRLAALRRMIDQHTSTSSQRICLELLKQGRISGHIRELTAAYRHRRDAAVEALGRFALKGMRWSEPEGGYYVWVSLPEGMRSLDLLAACRTQGVTFMPGSVFDVDEMDDTHIRLNFVRPDANDIERGIRTICDQARGLITSSPIVSSPITTGLNDRQY
jgi:GntR family transcriptional regulator